MKSIILTLPLIALIFSACGSSDNNSQSNITIADCNATPNFTITLSGDEIINDNNATINLTNDGSDTTVCVVSGKAFILR